MLFADFDKNEKERRMSSASFGWDSRVRTYDTGVKVLCVTTTPYPNVLVKYSTPGMACQVLFAPSPYYFQSGSIVFLFIYLDFSFLF